MEITFKTNIDLTSIRDSMELDSGQIVATLEINDEEKLKMTIEVQGDVKVFYKDDMYKCASQMPDELIKIFHDGYEDPEAIGLNVCENNWFEIYMEDENQCFWSDVVYVEGYTEEDLLSFMIDCYAEWKKEYEASKAEEEKKACKTNQ